MSIIFSRGGRHLFSHSSPKTIFFIYCYSNNSKKTHDTFTDLCQTDQCNFKQRERKVEFQHKDVWLHFVKGTFGGKKV